ncbi:MAG: hypothetical protein A7315_13575 [Candidatus Altiarchaeales archaeon WOR_SM1_79]|nr:MAG: hypothetical protein A7315_13575 [Candidatus Altiarchaeales archaeon WOR_SM1_79]
MKICMISSVFPPYSFGGVETHIKKISEYLEKDGNEVVIITLKPYTSIEDLKPSIEIRDKIKIYRFYPLNIYSRYSILKKPSIIIGLWFMLDFWNIHSYFVLKDILKKENPDIVHTHHLIGISPSAVFNVVKNLNLPLVHTLHGYSLLCPNAYLYCGSGGCACPNTFIFRNSEGVCKKPNIICKMYQSLSRYFNRSKPDFVISPSKFVLDIHLKNDFFKTSKKKVLCHGIELYNNLNNLKFNDFNKKTIINDNLNVLFVGRLEKSKGVSTLIEAFKELSMSNIKLHVVGDGTYKSVLENLSKNDERIIFYGKIPTEELQKFYRSCDVVVVPSLWHETLGIVIQESFRAGTPVIGSMMGGIPDLIEDGYNGFLFEAGDVNKLKYILEYLINNRPILKKLGENAIKSIKKHEMSCYIKNLERIYEEVVRQ